MTDTTTQGPTADLFDHVAFCIRQGHATDSMAANVKFLKGEFLRAFRSIDDAVAERTDELQRENSLWSERLEDHAARLALAIETLEYYAERCSLGHHPLEMPARKALMKLKEPMP